MWGENTTPNFWFLEENNKQSPLTQAQPRENADGDAVYTMG